MICIRFVYICLFCIILILHFPIADALRWLLPEFGCVKDNERTSFCIADCTSCDNREFCVKKDCHPGCDCRDHYFRETPNGKCIHVSECPRKECGENEMFLECGPQYQACGRDHSRDIGCSYSCFCKKGFKRNENGTCIPESECPFNCKFSEVRKKCGPLHEHCGDPKDNQTICKEACYCRENFRRNLFGHCILMNYCHPEKCLTDEILYDCVPTCNTTCDNYGNSTCKEDPNICLKGCFCSRGHVKNRDGYCIPATDCKQHNAPDVFAQAAAYVASVFQKAMFVPADKKDSEDESKSESKVEDVKEKEKKEPIRDSDITDEKIRKYNDKLRRKAELQEKKKEKEEEENSSSQKKSEKEEISTETVENSTTEKPRSEDKGTDSVKEESKERKQLTKSKDREGSTEDKTDEGKPVTKSKNKEDNTKDETDEEETKKKKEDNKNIKSDEPDDNNKEISHVDEFEEDIDLNDF